MENESQQMDGWMETWLFFLTALVCKNSGGGAGVGDKKSLHVTDNDSVCNSRGVIFLLITKLMTHYAPVDKQYGKLTHTYTHTLMNTHRDNGKVCFGAHKSGRLLCDELDSEITGKQWDTQTHSQQQQQLTGNLIKPALMKSLLPNWREQESSDERRRGGKEDKVTWIDNAH